MMEWWTLILNSKLFKLGKATFRLYKRSKHIGLTASKLKLSTSAYSCRFVIVIKLFYDNKKNKEETHN